MNISKPWVHLNGRYEPISQPSAVQMVPGWVKPDLIDLTRSSNSSKKMNLANVLSFLQQWTKRRLNSSKKAFSFARWCYFMIIAVCNVVNCFMDCQTAMPLCEFWCWWTRMHRYSESDLYTADLCRGAYLAKSVKHGYLRIPFITIGKQDVILKQACSKKTKSFCLITGI